MSEVKHTPGPWRYKSAKYDDWGVVRAPAPQGQLAGGIICQAFDPEVRDEDALAVHRANGTDPWEANARLIAAAPELLEACEEALATAPFGWPTAQTLRAAIAKAKGKP